MLQRSDRRQPKASLRSVNRMGDFSTASPASWVGIAQMQYCVCALAISRAHRAKVLSSRPYLFAVNRRYSCHTNTLLMLKVFGRARWSHPWQGKGCEYCSHPWQMLKVCVSYIYPGAPMGHERASGRMRPRPGVTRTRLLSCAEIAIIRIKFKRHPGNPGWS